MPHFLSELIATLHYEKGMSQQDIATKLDLSKMGQQEDPNYLSVRYNDKPEEIYKRGEGYLEPVAGANMRLPMGHPEGFFGAFANVYKNAVNTMRAKIVGEKPSEVDLDFPTVQDGAYGVNFIHKAVESSKKREWLKGNYTPPK